MQGLGLCLLLEVLRISGTPRFDGPYLPPIHTKHMQRGIIACIEQRGGHNKGSFGRVLDRNHGADRQSSVINIIRCVKRMKVYYFFIFIIFIIFFFFCFCFCFFFIWGSRDLGHLQQMQNGEGRGPFGSRFFLLSFPPHISICAEIASFFFFSSSCVRPSFLWRNTDTCMYIPIPPKKNRACKGLFLCSHPHPLRRGKKNKVSFFLSFSLSLSWSVRPVLELLLYLRTLRAMSLVIKRPRTYIHTHTASGLGWQIVFE